MHPALSIVFFTTSSGAGFALLVLLGIGTPLGLLPASRSFGFAALAIAVLLAAGGLASSVLHLGRPERAWRAFSQWRSSWLSREGVFSVFTFLPTAIFGIGWVLFGVTGGLIGLCGILAAALAATTIYCTGMIYASLRPMSGVLVLNLLIRLWSERPWGMALLTFIVTLAAWWIKERYWRFIGTTSAPSSVASATSLGSRGNVRVFESPHTEENFLLKEMGFAIARKHRVRLRRIVRLAGFVLPALLTLLALLFGGITGVVTAGLAAGSAAFGLVAERWLFFAEARHTVTLYYGAETV